MGKKRDSNALSPFQQLFCKSYIAHECNGTRAFLSLRPGITESNAATRACEYLRIPKIRAEIDRLLEEKFKTEHMSAGEIISELSRVARSDLSRAVDGNGNLLPLKEMPVEMRRAISSLEVETSKRGSKRKIRLWDKVSALNALAKIARLIQDKSEVNVHVSLEELVGGGSDGDDDKGEK